MQNEEVQRVLNNIAEHLESASGLILHVADKTVEVLDAIAEVFADESLDESAAPQEETGKASSESTSGLNDIAASYMVEYVNLVFKELSVPYLERLRLNDYYALRRLYTEAWQRAGRVGIEALRKQQ